MSNFGAELAAMAATQVGYVEGANNANKYGEYFGANNQPWCAYFILWCMAQLGVDGMADGFTGNVASFYSKNNTSVDSLVTGDIVCFGYNRSYWTSPKQHNEIFISYNADGTLNTIGGNTSGADGEGVWRKVRGRDEVSAAIHYDPLDTSDPLPSPTDPPTGALLVKPYTYYRTLNRW